LRAQAEVARYAGVRASSPGTNAYPGLAALGITRELPVRAHERVLRWVNVAIAACTVGERPVTVWALRVLGAMGTATPWQTERDGAVRGQAAVLATCLVHGKTD